MLMQFIADTVTVSIASVFGKHHFENDWHYVTEISNLTCIPLIYVHVVTYIAVITESKLLIPYSVYISCNNI